MYTYLTGNLVAGYSGYVVYSLNGDVNYWMVPGTYFDDWDCK